MSKINEIGDKLSNLTITEVVELIEILKDKWNIKNLENQSSNISENNIEKKIEKKIKTEFDIRLIDIGDKKIQIIKIVKEITGLGLKESKSLVDSYPSTIKSKINKEESEIIKKKFEENGATIELI